MTVVAAAAFQHRVWALRLEPLRLDVPTLRVDTSDGYRPAFEAIVEFARGLDAPGGRAPHVGGFTDWESQGSFPKAFDRVLRNPKAGA